MTPAELVAVPDIDDGIPLPPNAATALPDMTPAEELQMRARTIALLADIQGKSLQPGVEGQRHAESLARQMIEDRQLRPDYATYPNDTIAYLAGMVSQLNHSIVDDLIDLKLYVVNKLVYEVENSTDSKTRITALKALGEVDGVDAFKRRTETTIVHKTIEEVERELFSVLEGVEYASVGNKPAESALPSPEKPLGDVINDQIMAELDSFPASSAA